MTPRGVIGRQCSVTARRQPRFDRNGVGQDGVGRGSGKRGLSGSKGEVVEFGESEVSKEEKRRRMASAECLSRRAGGQRRKQVEGF